MQSSSASAKKKLQPIFTKKIHNQKFTRVHKDGLSQREHDANNQKRLIGLRPIEARRLDIFPNGESSPNNFNDPLDQSEVFMSSQKLNIQQQRIKTTDPRKRRLHSQYFNETVNIDSYPIPQTQPLSPVNLKFYQKPSVVSTKSNSSYSRTLMSQRFSNQQTKNRIQEKALQINLPERQLTHKETKNKNKLSINNMRKERLSIALKDDGMLYSMKELDKYASPKNTVKAKNFGSVLNRLFQGNLDSDQALEAVNVNDSCILKNAFNVIISPEESRSPESKKYLTVVSPRDSNNQSQQTRLNQDFNQSEDRIRTKSNTSNYQQGQLGQYIDFESIKEYFHKHDQIKHKYKNNDMNDLNIMTAEEFFILHKIFPKIFSLKSGRRFSVMSSPEQSQSNLFDFNPSSMTQEEIFMKKSEVYLHTQQWEKAQFFLQQGHSYMMQLTYSQSSLTHYDFRFNLGLLYYLTQDYSKSVQVYNELLNAISSKKRNRQREEKIQNIIFNLMIGLLQLGKPKEVLLLGQRLQFKKIRMTSDPTELKFQKLMIYAQQHSKTQESQENETELKIENTPEKKYLIRSDIDIIKRISEIKINDNIQEKTLNFANFRRTYQKNMKTKKTNKNSMIEIDKNKTGGEEQQLKDQVNQHLEEFNKTFDSIKSQGQSQKVKYVNKAKFVIDSIKSTQSPNYILSMKEIINSLNQKGDISNNKSLQYQLKNLEESISQPPITKNQQKIVQNEVLAFPLFKNHQIKGSGFQQDEDIDLKFEMADSCLRNLEELELELEIDHGNEISRTDPIFQHYKLLCNSIFNICQEEGLFEILKQAAQERKFEKMRKRRKGFFPKDFKPRENTKFSIAKDILVSALLRKRRGIFKVNAQGNAQIIEIEIFKDKIQQLREALREEIQLEERKGKSMEYMNQAEKEINKMLAIARKKQREREKYQEQDSLVLSHSPSIIDKNILFNLEEALKVKPLQQLLKKEIFKEEIAKRFKVQRQKYLTSLFQLDEREEKKPGNNMAEELLKNIKQTSKNEISNFGARTKEFLDYLFDNYGAYYVVQKTFCLSEFFDYAPENIISYFCNVASTLSSIPLRFEILTDNNIDDNEFNKLENTEFVYNRYDIIYQFLSQSIRQQKNIDSLGLDKHDWIIEVIQKFNLLSIINYIFREALSLYSVKQEQKQPEAEDIYRVNNEILLFESVDNKPIFTEESLKVIRAQFASLKFEGKMNYELIDKLFNYKLPLFKQYIKPIRMRIYELCSYKTIRDQEIIKVSELDSNSILIIMIGNLSLQVQSHSNSTWQVKQIFGSGSVIPVQYLYLMKHKFNDVRLHIDKEVKLHAEKNHLEFLEIDKLKLSETVFGSIKFTIMRKIQFLQNVDILGGYTSQMEKCELLSPYALFVLGCLCKVQVFRCSEVINRQNEVPKAMYVILEGQAQAVYEALLERKGEVSNYFRKSMRQDVPKKLKFGLRENEPEKVEQKTKIQQGIDNAKLMKQLQQKERGTAVSPLNDFKFNLNLNKEEAMNSKITSKSLNKTAKITFQNLVLNDKWDTRKPSKKIKYTNHVVFAKLQEGTYVSSRVFLDDAGVKNYIKYNSYKIQKLLRLPSNSNFFAYSSIPTSPKRRLDYKESLLDGQDNLEDISIFQTPKDQNFPKDKRNHEDYDYRKMKNFLLRSQLSVICKSSTLKAIVIQRSDKNYFNEMAKKILDERILEKEYIDTDRPIKKLYDLEKIIEKEMNWDKYKREFSEKCIEDSYYHRFSQYDQ